MGKEENGAAKRWFHMCCPATKGVSSPRVYGGERGRRKVHVNRWKRAVLAVAIQRKLRVGVSLVWAKSIPKARLGRARQTPEHGKRMCCFSVAAHRLLFIICTVVPTSVTDTYAGTQTGESLPWLECCCRDPCEFPGDLCAGPWSLSSRELQICSPRCWPSSFFIFSCACIFFAPFSLASWFTLIRKTCWAYSFVLREPLCHFSLSKSLLDIPTCMSFH